MDKTNALVPSEREDDKILCKNCSTLFTGNYCPHCGQSKLDYDKPFRFIIADFAGNMFAFDTRLWKSFVTILFRPGKYAMDYIHGKRARYMPPFRLYMFFSFIFLLIVGSIDVNIDSDNFLVVDEDDNITVFAMNEDSDDVDISQTVESAPDSITEQRIQAKRDSLLLKFEEISEEVKEETAFTLFGNDFEYDLVDIKMHPNAYIEKALKYFSWSMFFLMPLFASLLWLFFRKHLRNYIGHLIFSVNMHTFALVLFSFSLALLIYLPSGPVVPIIISAALVPIYSVIGMKRLYAAKIGRVLWRYWWVNVLHFFLVLFVNVIIIILGLARL